MLIRRCAVHGLPLDPRMRCPNGHGQKYFISRGVYAAAFELFDVGQNLVAAFVRDDDVQWLADEADPGGHVKLAGRDRLGISRDVRGRVNRVARGRGRRRSKDGGDDELE